MSLNTHFFKKYLLYVMAMLVGVNVIYKVVDLKCEEVCKSQNI